MGIEQKTRESFSLMRDEIDQFRGSMNDWIMFLNQELQDAKDEGILLKKRVQELEIERRLRF